MFSVVGFFFKLSKATATAVVCNVHSNPIRFVSILYNLNEIHFIFNKKKNRMENPNGIFDLKWFAWVKMIYRQVENHRKKTHKLIDLIDYKNMHIWIFLSQQSGYTKDTQCKRFSSVCNFHECCLRSISLFHLKWIG